MAHPGGPQPYVEVEAMIERQHVVQAAQGHCFWAVERRDDRAVVGFCELRIDGHAGTPVPDELEIGWRLARHAWGQGYAREAAIASVGWGWAHTDRPARD